MADADRLEAAAESGRAAAAETLAMMDRQRDEAAKLGIDLPALLAAEFARRPPATSPQLPKLVPRERPRPRLVFSKD